MSLSTLTTVARRAALRARPWLVVAFLFVATSVVSPRAAEATCRQSQIALGVASPVVGATVPGSWAITPACDVIKTGLLFGTSPQALEPVGQPAYNVLSVYEDSLSVHQSGAYWVAAYAVDEEGIQISSAPQSVVVVIPPRGIVQIPEAQAAALAAAPDPLLSGTDDDFLQPRTGRVFASLRRVETTDNNAFIQQVFNTIPPTVQTSGNALRLFASTHRDEVAAGLTTIQVGDLTVDINPADVLGALEQLDQGFATAGFPRAGLYSVACRLSLDRNVVTEGPLCFGDPSTYLPGRVIFSGVGYRDNLRERHDQFFDFIAPLTDNSTASYFIPRTEPGQALVSARLRSFLVSSGDPSTVTINGQRAQLDSPISCFGDPPVCFGNASWDLTAAAAAEIGGELPVSFDPNPPAFDGIRGFEHDRIRGYGLNISVNYPWATLNTSSVLELTYQQTCPKQLNLAVTPASVRPVIGGAAQSATVQAFVHTCPPGGGGGPASVDVTLTVQPPHPGDPGDADGGHRHGERPSKAFGTLNGQNQQPVVCTAVINATGTGSCTVTYRPSEVGGVETVTASAAGFPGSQAQVTVEVPDLQELLPDPARYVLVGTPDNFARTNDPCRPDRPTSEHFKSHFAVEAMRNAVMAIADKMSRDTGILLRVNDMSLPRGGLFDTENNWSSPHDGHRLGREADIGFNGVRNGMCSAFSQTRLFETIRNITRRVPLIEASARGGPHFHARLP